MTKKKVLPERKPNVDTIKWPTLSESIGIDKVIKKIKKIKIEIK